MPRPPTYQSDDERPISVSLRIPKAVYAQVHQRVQQRRMTLTEALLEGLQLWLETPADPREAFLSDERSTVMQQLQEMVTATVQTELAKLLSMALPLPTQDIQPTNNDILYDNGTTVIQEGTTKQCRSGHEPYPATRAECPGCVRERQRRKRDRAKPRTEGV